MKEQRAFIPAWSDEAPEAESYRSIFKWGAPDRFKHPNHRLYDMIKNKFNLTDDDFSEKNYMGNEPVMLDSQSRIQQEHLDRLSAIAGIENVSSDDYSRLKYASGKTT